MGSLWTKRRILLPRYSRLILTELTGSTPNLMPMIPSYLGKSRYLPKARAANIARLVAVGAIVVLPVACSSSDEAAFTTSDTTAQTTAETTAQATADATSAPDTTEATATTQGTTVPAGGSAIPAGSELTIDFTYAASGGQAKNPYIAAWVEDADGNLVQTISLWFESGKGEKWLDDLSAWYAAAGSTDVTTSGATRAPSTYQVAWDGTTWEGTAAPAGSYVIYVEAAREHGPHSLTSTEITLDGNSINATLNDNEELSALTVTVA